jgi:hypothetical protein
MSRPEERYNVDFQVFLAWQDPRGVHRTAARCTDLSASGAHVETLDRLTPQSIVLVTSQHFGRMGNATVRYCQREGMKYSVGLYFTNPFALGDPVRKQILEEILKQDAK